MTVACLPGRLSDMTSILHCKTWNRTVTDFPARLGNRTGTFFTIRFCGMTVPVSYFTVSLGEMIVTYFPVRFSDRTGACLPLRLGNRTVTHFPARLGDMTK